MLTNILYVLHTKLNNYNKYGIVRRRRNHINLNFMLHGRNTDLHYYLKTVLTTKLTVYKCNTESIIDDTQVNKAIHQI